MPCRVFLLGLIAAVLTGSGCKSKPALVGSWSGQLQTHGKSVDMTVKFGGDGTLSIKEFVGAQGGTSKGTYKADEKSLTFTLSSVEGTGIPREKVDEQNAALAMSPKTTNFSLEWKNEDTILITEIDAPPGQDKAITLRRKKG